MHIQKTILNNTAFRGTFEPDNVGFVAERVEANYFTHFNPNSHTQGITNPEQQITQMRLTGGEDFAIEYAIIPTQPKVIQATVATEGIPEYGYGFVKASDPSKFGDNIVKATREAVISLSNSDAYINYRADALNKNFWGRGFKLRGLHPTCKILPVQDRNDFLTVLRQGVGSLNGEGRMVDFLPLDRKIFVAIERKTSEIKLPNFGVLRSKGQILAERLLELLR